MNRSNGEITKKNPRALGKNVAAIVEIKLDRPVCLELFKDSKALGRFTLRSGNSSVAAGVVTKILEYTKGRLVEDK